MKLTAIAEAHRHSPVSAKNCRFSVDLPYDIANNAMWHNWEVGMEDVRELTDFLGGTAVRFAKVLVAATDVLGDRSKAREWLLSENRALGGQRPIDLLDTGIGFEDVMDVLRRIEHGVYS